MDQLLPENMQWLCGCGTWVEEPPGHCPNCGHDAPWGCDCSDCAGFDDDPDADVFEYGDGYAVIP